MDYKSYNRCVKISEINNTVIENDLFNFLYDVRKNTKKEIHESDSEEYSSSIESYYYKEMLVFYKTIGVVRTGYDFYDTMLGIYIETYTEINETSYGSNRSFFNFYDEYIKKEFKMISS